MLPDGRYLRQASPHPAAGREGERRSGDSRRAVTEPQFYAEEVGWGSTRWKRWNHLSLPRLEPEPRERW